MEGLYIIIISIIGSHIVGAVEDWGYWGDTGPKNWPGVCKVGKRQSPIDIFSEDAIKIDIGPLKFIRYDFAFASRITNTGHSVQIKFDGVPILLEGGDLPSTYILDQMHFHWGAEHTVDGIRHPLELHLVHYNSQYENSTMASLNEDGLAVVATLFELSSKDNRDLKPILKATELVSKWVGQSTGMMNSKIIPYMFLPKDHTTYYRYDGSLTTPGCQESVLWFVLTEKLKVSREQISIFQTVAGPNGTLKFNYRPTQDLAGRKVYHHLDGYSSGSSVSSNLLYTFLSLLLVRLLQSSD